MQAVLGTNQRAAVRHSRRDRRRLHAAGDSGTEPVRRLRVPGPRSERRRHQPARAGDAGDCRRRQRVAEAAAAALQHLHRQRPAAAGHDRPRARAGAGLPLSEITSALQIFLGSQYVNDFEFNNRAYRVYVQADQSFRSNPQALRQLYGRTRTASMVPLEQVVRMKETTAPQVISHFNLFRSASINGSAAQGVSSGEALAEMERLAGDDAAGRHGLRLVGHLARRVEGRTAVLPDLRAGAAPRLPDARGAVRKPRAAVHRAAGRADRGPRGAAGAVVARLRQRRLLPGRPGHAGRAWRPRTRS